MLFSVIKFFLAQWEKKYSFQPVSGLHFFLVLGDHDPYYLFFLLHLQPLPLFWFLLLSIQTNLNLLCIKNKILRASLAVQWLRLCIANARGHRSMPGRGIKIPHAARRG